MAHWGVNSAAKTDPSHGSCSLCTSVGKLRNSHIVPKFVVQWLKQTGAGYLRQAVNPNKRKQDGPKEYLLCEKCEQMFSSRESYFADNVFFPLVGGKAADFVYDERLFYCFISILWRGLVSGLKKGGVEGSKYLPLVETAERDWRDYLMGVLKAPKFADLHVFFSDVATNDTIPVKGFNAYLTRAIDATVASSDIQCFVYAKFGRVLLFSHLTPFEEYKWINTAVKVDGGRLMQPQRILDGLGNFLISRAEGANQAFEAGMNDKSKETIHRHFEKIFPTIIGNDMFKAQAADFAKPVVPPGHK